ncbi:MAG: flagellar biosynthesis protein FlgM [Gemmatimonadetes bacterium]|nr:flagellar biosynthesis protein FlgM [Gemmatimonadota bacterium]
MRWQGRAGSSNVQDRRGMRMPGGMVGGGAGLIIAIIAALFFSVDPGTILNQAPAVQESAPPTAADDEAKQFVSVILGDTEKTWNDLLRQRGVDYPEPTLVLFSGAVQSACGMAGSATEPFYCPNDQQLYLDTYFFTELSQRFGAPGDFAQAYVIAHEVGHHVQNVLGVFEKTRPLQERGSQEQANAIQVRIELQADCLAGVWWHYAKSQQDFLEWGDIEEGLRAASSIGDDRLQQQSQGRVVPESFTHGSSEQRVRWFKTGIESGAVESCDTFQGSV